MYAAKSFVIFAMAIFLIQTKADSEGNVHLFKTEIAKATEQCGETKDTREAARDEFDRRASSTLNMKRHKRENEPNFYDNDSEDWDYDDGNKGNGKSWNNPKDNKYAADSVYGHNRRNDSRGNNGFSRSVHDQNSTKTGQRYAENDFDSREGRFVPEFMMGNDENRKKNSYKDNESNLNPYYYSNKKKSVMLRKKRNSALMKSSSDNEVNIKV